MLLGGLAVAFAFVLALSIGTGIAAGVAHGLDRSLETDHLHASGALLLLLAEVVVLVGGALAARIAFGRVAWPSRSGLVGRANGWLALVPFVLVVFLPGFLLSLADGDLVDSGVDLDDALAFLLLALAIGLAEELWFRGVLVEVLGGRARPWLAVLGSALLFGLPHLAGDAASLLNAGAVTLAVGVPFAVVRLRARSLWPLVAAHTLIDAWAFLHTSGVVATGSPSPGEIVAGLLLPGALALGYCLWLARSEPAEGRGAGA